MAVSSLKKQRSVRKAGAEKGIIMGIEKTKGMGMRDELLQLARTKIEHAEERFDPKEDMLTVRQTKWAGGYHTRKTGILHPLRDAVEYADAIFQTGEEKWYPRGERILRKIVSLQDTRAESKTCGLWPYYLEENLESMIHPDYNWADFISKYFLYRTGVYQQWDAPAPLFECAEGKTGDDRRYCAGTCPGRCQTGACELVPGKGMGQRRRRSGIVRTSPKSHPAGDHSKLQVSYARRKGRAADRTGAGHGRSVPGISSV